MIGSILMIAFGVKINSLCLKFDLELKNFFQAHGAIKGLDLDNVFQLLCLFGEGIAFFSADFQKMVISSYFVFF